MYKILDGIKQLKGATLAIEEVVNIVSIVSVDVFGETSIHVKTLRDLEQIPGELELVKVGYGSCYQFEARKMLDGVRFFCLLEAGEAEELRKSAWTCKCECENITNAFASDLTSGRKRSCGCLRREVIRDTFRKHGMSGNKERLYRIWKQMRQRCLNKNDCAYDRYGGRGIAICNGWDEYTEFHSWAITNGYGDNLSIDRIDNDGSYCPENCRWATCKEQNYNSRKNHMVTFDGEAKALAEWTELLGLNYGTITWK